MRTSNAKPLPLGVTFRTLDREQSVETAELLADSSIKAVELTEPIFDKSESNVQRMRRAFAEAGVDVRTVHSNFGANLDISSPDGAIRAAGLDAVRAAIDLAGRMGASIVIAHASSEPIVDDERARRMEEAARSINTLARMAGEAGCRIAVELLPRTCLGRSVDELLHLLQGLPEDAAGVCLDANHFMDRFDFIPDVVRRLGPRLIALHCSDYDGIDEKHWPPMRGVVDWAAFLSALRDVGFDGPLNYEAILEGDTPAQRLAFLEDNYANLITSAGIERA